MAKPVLKSFQVSVDAGAYIVVQAKDKDDAREKVGNMPVKDLLRELEGNIEVGSDIQEA